MTEKTNQRGAKANGSQSSAPPAMVDKSRSIEIGRKEDETDDQSMARMLVRGTVANASTIVNYSRAQHACLSWTDIARALKDQGEAVNRGDLSSLERMLNGQAVALNAMFTELARRGAGNMGEDLDTMDRYIRLALKAQSQSRATVETLAAIKNPPVVITRQANINNGGQQQVNDGLASDSVPVRAGAHAPAANSAIKQNELLEATDGERLDTRAQGAPGGANPHLETVGEVNRATHP